VRAAIAIFGSVQLGVNVQAAQESQFDDGQPWNYVRGSRDLGGHAMHVAGYTPWARPVTWAREISTTSTWWQHQVEECWVVIWPEHFSSRAFQAGMDVAALASAYKDLTGRDFPVQPQPAPSPVPVVAADAGLAEAAHRWVDRHHRVGGNAELATALRTWLAAHKL
jgi:hypothetical protein